MHVASLDNAGPLRRSIAAVAAASARRPLVVLIVALLATLAAGSYVARRIAIDTDSAKLISARLAWRERSAAFEAAFPQRADLIAIVVDGSTPEVAERAAATLAERLAKDTASFRGVRRPDGGPFFARNGLLFLSTDEVTKTTEQLVEAQPLLGTLAADPSVRGLMTTLGLALEGVRRGEAELGRLAPGLAALDATLASVVAGRPEPLSWRSLLGGRAPDARELRRFVLAQPVLDYTALKPGAKATAAIRRVAHDYAIEQGLDARALRVRLTGNVPMADEEFGTLEENAVLNTSAMLLALVLMLWVAVRSIRATIASVACLVVGLSLTAAFGLAVFGVLNLISVAFAVLFVGLGVDFSIQYAVAYRAHHDHDGVAAARRAALAVGSSLLLAAVAIAAGFFAFEPTDYRGVSELGVIAGFGMVVAFAASITLLPALLVLSRIGPSRAGMAFGEKSAIGRIGRVLEARRRRVLVVTSIAAIASLVLLPMVRFDFDPLHLRSPETEAVATILDLSKDPMTTPNTIDVLVPSIGAAKAMAAKLAALPEVEHALDLASFVPADQDAKLAIIADAAALLGPTLEPGTVMPAPTDAETARALSDASRELAEAASRQPDSDAGRIAARVSQTLATLAGGSPQARQALDRALVPGLEVTLAQARDALQAGPVTLETLPSDLVRDWVAADGRARVQVFPKPNRGAASPDPSRGRSFDENRALSRFIAAVRTVAPDATGAPISIQESANTIIHAFVVAGLLAMASITVLLVIVLRRARDVLVTLASLVLGGLVTLGLCAVFDIALNFENVIALPLLFGIGVAFNIYFVIAWRHGTSHLLETSLARAVVFSALTTATAFGSLWLSSHPGTASMGKLLALSLACTLAAALVVLPALLGPPPDHSRVRGP